MKPTPMPSLEYLHECYELNSDSPSGVIWRIRPLKHFTSQKLCDYINNLYAGKPCFCFRRGDYFHTFVKGRSCVLHRLIYCLANNTIDIDNYQIDHIDRNPLNNNPSNLRLATPSQNSGNTKLRSTNKSGFVGVSWAKIENKWIASICHQGKKFRIGKYDTAKEASDAYQERVKARNK